MIFNGWPPQANEGAAGSDLSLLRTVTKGSAFPAVTPRLFAGFSLVFFFLYGGVPS
jgi:hypothetical protein